MRLIKVKPLVWYEVRKYHFEADASQFRYRISPHSGLWLSTRESHAGLTQLGSAGLLFIAKQLCQDHWEKHVRGEG